MIKAIWRAAAVGRVGMFIAVLVIVTLARLGGAIREGDAWVGSESQATIAVVVLAMVLPVFVAMLATTLLRGEHAPWSWGLARPVSRLRLIGSLVALDAATIGACMFAAWLVLGGFGASGGLLYGVPSGMTVAVFTFLYANLYMVAAIAGSRTTSTVRAAAVAVIILGVSISSVSSLVSSALKTVPSFALHESWARSFVFTALGDWSGPAALNEAHTWWLLAGFVLVVAAVSGPVTAFADTARFAPGPVRLRRAAMQTAALLALSALLIVPGWVAAYGQAPAEARKGDKTLRVVFRTPDPSLRVVSVRLTYDGVHVPRRPSTLHAARHRSAARTFVELSPGRFEVCAYVQKRISTPDAGERSFEARNCMPVIITDDPLQELPIDITFDGIQPSP